MTTTRFYEIALGITLFLQVLFYKLIPIGIILIALTLITMAIRKELKFSGSILHYAFVAFYLTFVIGFTFTVDPKEAAHVLESKMSFVIFPILFLFSPKKRLNFAIPICFFVVSLIAQFFFGLYKSSLCYGQLGSIGCFMSTNFSSIHHPTYMAIYYLMGAIQLIYAVKNKLFGFNKITLILLLNIFTLGYFMCLSLSGILFLFLLIGVVGFWWINKYFGLKKAILSVVGILSAMILFVSTNSAIQEDIHYTKISLMKYFESPTEYVKNANRYLIGNEERLVLWTVSAQAIAEKPFGYGTGNIDEVLGAKFEQYGLSNLAEKEFNPHNQYLQTWIEIGLIGFLLLIGIYFLMILKGFQLGNISLLILGAAFAFNSLFESMLQRQSGIVFIVLLSFFFLLQSQQKEKTIFAEE